MNKVRLKEIDSVISTLYEARERLRTIKGGDHNDGIIDYAIGNIEKAIDKAERAKA